MIIDGPFELSTTLRLVDDQKDLFFKLPVPTNMCNTFEWLDRGAVSSCLVNGRDVRYLFVKSSDLVLAPSSQLIRKHRGEHVP